MLGNQMVFTPSIKVIAFSKYLSFDLGGVIGHANWANLILTFVWLRVHWYRLEWKILPTKKSHCLNTN